MQFGNARPADLIMWFRRKKKPDPDNALNETLRSLQNLLEEDNSSDQRSEPKAAKSAEDSHSDFNFPDLLSEQEIEPGKEGNSAGPTTEENQVRNPITDPVDDMFYEGEEAVSPAEENEIEDSNDSTDLSDSIEPNGHQTEVPNSLMDFYPDLSMVEGSEEKQSQIDPFQNEDDQQSAEDLIVELHNEDITQDDIVIPAIDTIPVLNNVVYIPPEVEADTTVTSTAIDLDQLIDETVEELRARLEEYDLNAINRDEELALRRTLTQILNNKNIN